MKFITKYKKKIKLKIF